MSDFQKRHYELVAEVLKAHKPEAEKPGWGLWYQLVRAFEDRFIEDSSRFKPHRYRKACGWEEVRS